jgi:hypothetical protein
MLRYQPHLGPLQAAPPAFAEQIDDHRYWRHNKPQVNQSTGHVKAETQKTQNQEHNTNCSSIRSLLNLFLICY